MPSFPPELGVVLELELGVEPELGFVLGVEPPVVEPPVFAPPVL
jgi:hypothetical protein